MNIYEYMTKGGGYLGIIAIIIGLPIIWYECKAINKAMESWFDKEYQKRRKEEQYIKDNTRFED